MEKLVRRYREVGANVQKRRTRGITHVSWLEIHGLVKVREYAIALPKLFDVKAPIWGCLRLG